MAAAAAGDCSAAEVAAFRSALSPEALAGFYLVGDLQGARDAAARALARDLGAARCSALTSKVKPRVQQEYCLWRTRQSRGARAVPDRPSSSEVGPQHVLDLWFGPQPDAWRNSLWFLGVDPDAPERGDGGLVEPLRTMYLPLIESCRGGLSGSPLEEWTGTIQGRVALVVVLDQFPRLVVPGTPDMLMCAGLAQEVAKEVLSDQGEELPWAHRLFCYLALMHAEDLELVSEGALNILRLTESFDSRDSYRGLSAHLRDTWLVAQEHLSLLRRFGRYPHYNLSLGRESTEAEATWLRSKKLPFWAARSTFVGSSSQAGAKKQAEQKPLVLPSGVKHNRLHILVLHGMKMNGKSFEKKARNFFGPLRDLAELVFIDGPRPYVAAGETGPAGIGVRCWYDSTDDSGSMQYVGLGDTLGYMERVCAESGPFDGVLGFSQGGCLAAIMAALQKSTLKFRFCVIISAPYCRDSKRLELHLKEAPVDHIEGCVRPRVEPLEMPSFHVWGSTDTQIEPWRSELLSRVFKDPVVHTHTAGHWAPSNWPAKELAVWLRDTIGLPSDDATVGASLEIDERLRKLSLTAKLVRGQGGVEVVVPSDIEQALEICRTDQELLLKLLNLVLGRLRSTPGTSFPEVAYIIVAALLEEVTDLEEHRRQLHHLQEVWGWRAFTQLDAALQNSDAKPGVSGDLCEALRSAIVDIFAQQLEQDAEAAASWMRVAPAEAQQSLTHLLAWRVDGMAEGLARPSECAREAPRFGGALYKATYLALRVASRMHEVRTGKALERPRDQQPELRKMYGAVLHDIITICDAFDEDKALAAGLVGSSVRHLYANGNGLSAVGAEAIAAVGGSFLHTLSLGDNRLNDDGTVAVAKHCGGVVRLALAASGISDVGARSLADLIRASRVLRWLDLGISKSTAALGEVPNRLGDLGAEFLAEALGGPGDVQAPLNALVLVHNSITAPGVRALQAAAQRSKTLVKLELDYLDARGQELAREEIRAALTRNLRTLEAAGDAGELRARREALDPEHLEEIKSVYRVGNAYSPGGQ
mmetsp:Transcript_123181/g.394552  ORF Transcript_123181/g.394552 Transcript_123181/m.394552 type:complete len:1041 (-) Transcript_123181:103-3225(-)